MKLTYTEYFNTHVVKTKRARIVCTSAYNCMHTPSSSGLNRVAKRYNVWINLILINIYIVMIGSSTSRIIQKEPNRGVISIICRLAGNQLSNLGFRLGYILENGWHVIKVITRTIVLIFESTSAAFDVFGIF